MDEELKQLAMLALLNAFWRDFSALCNKYVIAADGLNTDLLELRMQEMSSVFGRNEDADRDDSINLWSMNAYEGTCGHRTMVEALSHKDATQIRRHLTRREWDEQRDFLRGIHATAYPSYREFRMGVGAGCFGLRDGV